MKSERIILSFVAVLIGLLVAGGAFYIFQMTKQITPSEGDAITVNTRTTPTPSSNLLLTVTSPKDEEVITKKTIIISGKTDPEATVIVSSETEDQVVKPAKTGNFSVTHTVGDDGNLIKITAVFPNGEETSVTRIVSYSTEEF